MNAWHDSLRRLNREGDSRRWQHEEDDVSVMSHPSVFNVYFRNQLSNFLICQLPWWGYSGLRSRLNHYRTVLVWYPQLSNPALWWLHHRLLSLSDTRSEFVTVWHYFFFLFWKETFLRNLSVFSNYYIYYWFLDSFVFCIYGRNYVVFLNFM